jgi:hypothetical protein
VIGVDFSDDLAGCWVDSSLERRQRRGVMKK